MSDGRLIPLQIPLVVLDAGNHRWEIRDAGDRLVSVYLGIRGWDHATTLVNAVNQQPAVAELVRAARAVVEHHEWRAKVQGAMGTCEDSVERTRRALEPFKEVE